MKYLRVCSISCCCCCRRPRMPFRNALKSWSFWMRVLLLLFYAIMVFVILPMLVVKVVKDLLLGNYSTVPPIGGVFVLATLPIAFRLITQHMRYYTKPKLQKHIIRILWMVPIYSINAWFSLLFSDNVLVLDSLRECYEAYVIYSFMRFLFNYLHENVEDLEETLRNKRQIHHFFPLHWMDDWPMGRDLIHKCKHWILQYTVIRPIMTIFFLYCQSSGDEGTKNVGFFVSMAVNNVSQFAAMYCLALFYWATKEELAPMRPLPKFLCIKAVVFFSFFQSVILHILVWTGILNPFLTLSNIDGAASGAHGGRTAAYLQNALLCVEMFLAAIGHHYSFTITPYMNDGQAKKSWKEAFFALLDFSDVGADIKEHLGVLGSSIKDSIKTRNVTQLAPIFKGTVPKVEKSPLLNENLKPFDFESSSSLSTIVHRGESPSSYKAGNA